MLFNPQMLIPHVPLTKDSCEPYHVRLAFTRLRSIINFSSYSRNSIVRFKPLDQWLEESRSYHCIVIQQERMVAGVLQCVINPNVIAAGKPSVVIGTNVCYPGILRM